MKIGLELNAQSTAILASSGPPAPTVVGTLADQTFYESSGNWNFDASTVFSGENLTFSMGVQVGISIDNISGNLTFDTAVLTQQVATSVTVVAINAGGSAQATFLLTILPPNIAPSIVSSSYSEPLLTVEVDDPEDSDLVVFWATFASGANPTASDVRSGTGAFDTGNFAAVSGQITSQSALLNKGFTPAGNNQIAVVVEDDLDLLSAVDAQAITVSYNPDAFVVSDWSVVASSGGGALDVSILSLPNPQGQAVTNVEYQVDGGSWVSSGGTTGFQITGLVDGQSYTVRLRAVNSEGPGDIGDAQSATPGAGISYSDANQFAPDLDHSEWNNSASLVSGWDINPALRNRLNSAVGGFGGHTFSAGVHTVMADIRRTSAGGSADGRLEIYENGGAGLVGINIDPDNGTVSSLVGTPVAHSDQTPIDLGNGVYRVWFKLNLTGGLNFLLDVNDHNSSRGADWRRAAIFEADLSTADIASLIYGS